MAVLMVHVADTHKGDGHPTLVHTNESTVQPEINHVGHLFSCNLNSGSASLESASPLPLTERRLCRIVLLSLWSFEPLVPTGEQTLRSPLSRCSILSTFLSTACGGSGVLVFVCAHARARVQAIPH